MKNIWNKYKLILLFVINAIPFLLNVVFYKNGVMDDLVFYIPIFAALTTLNFKKCDKTLHYIIIQLYVLVCIIFSGYVSTNLYYNNVSDDSMTLIVGELFVFAEAAINVIVTTLIVCLKVYKLKKRP